MSIDNWLRRNTAALLAAGIETARLDCIILLEDALGKDRSWILAHSDETLPATTVSRLQQQIERRTIHEPLAYIRGTSEFYGRPFAVNPHLLVPRPESEDMVSLLIRTLNSLTRDAPSPAIVDIGTGSGALAITAQLELPQSIVLATDIDPDCLAIAQQNATTHHANIHCLTGDLLEPLSHLLSSAKSSPITSAGNTADQINDYILLCNLPYVPDAYPINRAASHEPALALFSGADGLDHYRKLFDQISALENKPLFVFTECLIQQQADLRTLAATHKYTQVNDQGLIQCFELTQSLANTTN